MRLCCVLWVGAGRDGEGEDNAWEEDDGMHYLTLKGNHDCQRLWTLPVIGCSGFPWVAGPKKVSEWPRYLTERETKIVFFPRPSTLTGLQVEAVREWTERARRCDAIRQSVVSASSLDGSVVAGDASQRSAGQV